MLPELVRRGVTPDVVTDQTSAHDTLNGYVPDGMSLGEAGALRAADPRRVRARVPTASIVAHVRAMLELQRRGAVTFDYGNNIRTVAFDAGVAERVRHSRDSSRSTSGRCSARGRGRSAGSRCPAIRRTSHRTDELVLELFPHDEHLRRWITLARERIALPGTAGAHLLAGAGRARAVRRRAQRPRRAAASCRRRSSSGATTSTPAASRRRSARPKAMKDGSDAIADWAILNALLNVASGASWVSFHHGGGVGIGNSLHAGQVIVADGTPEMRVRLERVLTNDPGIGVARHADAGYEIAIETAEREGIGCRCVNA